jgi:hypothetical protein
MAEQAGKQKPRGLKGAGRELIQHKKTREKENGSPGRIRTYDQSINSRLLYH